ncbi:hypothetical protein HIM_09146 [Hirsutella minnesotensis 3608]|uniref:Uncharacterized protein n=1 Tax=Hirsutella minnesotensis 3608 TaxID=1043627 RepID=A0A0F7ZLT8_9HYPO|nr:hypothetical protein HIM_09146 [Hirsutella minnesotensis 3608]
MGRGQARNVGPSHIESYLASRADRERRHVGTFRREQHPWKHSATFRAFCIYCVRATEPRQFILLGALEILAVPRPCSHSAQGIAAKTIKVLDQRGAGHAKVLDQRRGAGQAKVLDQRGAGQAEVLDQRGAGQAEVLDQRGAGQAEVLDQRGAGQAKVFDQRGAGQADGNATHLRCASHWTLPRVSMRPIVFQDIGCHTSSVAQSQTSAECCA